MAFHVTRGSRDYRLALAMSVRHRASHLQELRGGRTAARAPTRRGPSPRRGGVPGRLSVRVPYRLELSSRLRASGAGFGKRHRRQGRSRARDRPRWRSQQPRPVAVAVGGAPLGALMTAGADRLGSVRDRRGIHPMPTAPAPRLRRSGAVRKVGLTGFEPATPWSWARALVALRCRVESCSDLHECRNRGFSALPGNAP
jgi:hypothetical protein